MKERLGKIRFKSKNRSHGALDIHRAQENREEEWEIDIQSEIGKMFFCSTNSARELPLNVQAQKGGQFRLLIKAELGIFVEAAGKLKQNSKHRSQKKNLTLLVEP